MKVKNTVKSLKIYQIIHIVLNLYGYNYVGIQKNFWDWFKREVLTIKLKLSGGWRMHELAIYCIRRMIFCY
jgi:hypothetical protein